MEAAAKEINLKPLKDRKYLSRSELAEGFGAKPEDLDAVEHFAQQHNLLVAQRDAASRTLVLKGRLGDLLNAFPADVYMYQHAGGAYRGRRGEILIPSALQGVITGIFGFDTRPKHRTPTRRLRSLRSRCSTEAVQQFHAASRSSMSF